MTVVKNLVLLLAVVAFHLPLSVVSMQTPNGYICNLCHSLQNEYPYPPPSAEQKVVQFSQSEIEQFGSPWDRGVTCLAVWDTVLDFANPNVVDEASCRSMAAAYAPQCCQDVPVEEETRSNPVDEQQEEQEDNGKEEEEEQQQQQGDFAASTDVDELSMVTKNEVVSRVSEKKQMRPSTKRIPGLITDNGRNDDKTEDSTNSDNNHQRRTASTSYLRGK